MNKIWIADLQILGSAFFFGIGFIGQRAVSVDGLGPMTCNALRFAMSALLLVMVLPWIPAKYLAQVHASEGGIDKDEANNLLDDEIDDKDTRRDELKSSRGADISSIFPKYLVNLASGGGAVGHNGNNAQRTVLFWGVFLGCINFMGSGLQQVGISMISANKVAFIAGFDLFLVPIFALFVPTFKRNGRPSLSTWIAVSISVLGLYLLSDADFADLEMGRGEIITIVSTVFWTLHITYTDISSSYVDSLHMMTVQLSVVALLSSLAAAITEPQLWFLRHLVLIGPWMIFLAVVEGLGFTLMALGQNYSPPTHAAILLSLEGVFASVFSYFVLSETMSRRELAGCAFMLLATFVAKIGIPGLDSLWASATSSSSNSSVAEKGDGGINSGSSSNSSGNDSSSGPLVLRIGRMAMNITRSLCAILMEGIVRTNDAFAATFHDGHHHMQQSKDKGLLISKEVSLINGSVNYNNYSNNSSSSNGVPVLRI